MYLTSTLKVLNVIPLKAATVVVVHQRLDTKKTVLIQNNLFNYAMENDIDRSASETIYIYICTDRSVISH